MARVQINPQEKVLSLLSTYWTPANTDGVIPTFSKIYLLKRADAGEGDIILTKRVGTNPIENSVNGLSVVEVFVVAIDVRTMYGFHTADLNAGDNHLTKMRNEIYRILDSHFTQLGDGINTQKILDIQELSDKNTGLFREIINVELRALNSTR